MTCPYCESTYVDAEFVDVGVGVDQQVSPYFCGACEALQMNPYADNLHATEEERKIGWFRGPSGPNRDSV